MEIGLQRQYEAYLMGRFLVTSRCLNEATRRELYTPSHENHPGLPASSETGSFLLHA